MNYLFLCSLGECRSAIAARAYAVAGAQTRYAGVADTARVPVTAEDLRWADRVIVLDEDCVHNVQARLAAAGARATCTTLPVREVFRPRCPELQGLLARNPNPAQAMRAVA